MVLALWQVKEWTSEVLTLLFSSLCSAARRSTAPCEPICYLPHGSTPELSTPEIARAAPWLRRVDGVVCSASVGLRLCRGFDHQLLAGFLAGIAMGYVVVFLVVEPATTRALFLATQRT